LALLVALLPLIGGGSGVAIADDAPKALARPSWSVSLGSRGLWTTQGILGSFSLGKFSRWDCPGSFYQGRAGMGYMYRPWLSGSAETRVSGGVDDAGNTFAYNRYGVTAREFRVRGDMVWYLSEALGFDQGTGIEWGTRNGQISGGSDECLEIGKSQGFGVGFGGGLGWKMTRLWGIFANGQGEYTWDGGAVGELDAGTSLDLAGLWPSLQKQVQGLFVFAEYTQLWRNDGWESAIQVGSGIGF
jgi:hypothetical protein